MYNEAEQVSLFDQDTWSGKTCPERSAAELQKVQTSRRSLKRSSKLQSQMPICMCVCRTEDGQNPDAITLKTEAGALPIGCTMLNTGAFRSGENGLLYLQTSEDSARQKYCLTINCGEKPGVEIKTKLSEILEEHPDKKYDLSQKACQGILNRAERRGKKLPEQLEAALIATILADTEANAIPVEFKVVEDDMDQYWEETIQRLKEDQNR